MLQIENERITKQLYSAEKKNEQYRSRIQKLRSMISALKSALQETAKNVHKSTVLVEENISSKKRPRNCDSEDSKNKMLKLQDHSTDIKVPEMLKIDRDVPNSTESCNSSENNTQNLNLSSAPDSKPMSRKAWKREQRRQYEAEKAEHLEKLNCLSTEEKLQQTKLADFGKFIIEHECDCWVVVDFVFERSWRYTSKIYTFKIGDMITLLFRKPSEHKFPCASVFKPSNTRLTITNCKGNTASLFVQQKTPLMETNSEFSDISWRLANADRQTYDGLKLHTSRNFSLERLGLQLQMVPPSFKITNFHGLEIVNEQDSVENQGKLMTSRELLSVKHIDSSIFVNTTGKTVLLNSVCWFVFTHQNKSKQPPFVYVLRKKLCRHDVLRKRCTAEMKNLFLDFSDCNGKKFQLDYKLLAPNIQMLGVLSGKVTKSFLKPKFHTDFCFENVKISR